MGREATITAAQVHAVADAIKFEGGKPTLRAVRERLGTGSMGTINKHLQDWKAGEERQQVVERVIPPRLQRAILDFMAVELAAERVPLEADLAEQLQTVTDLASENERQAGAIEDQAVELAALAAEKATAEGKAVQLATDLAAARDETMRERQAAETCRMDLAKASLRLEALQRLEGDLATLRDELMTERQARIEAEQHAAVLAAQKADLEGRLADAKKEAERSAEQLQKAQERAEQLSTSLTDARVSVQSQQSRIKDLTVQIDQARADVRAADEKAAVLSAQLVSLKSLDMPANKQ